LRYDWRHDDPRELIPRVLSPGEVAGVAVLRKYCIALRIAPGTDSRANCIGCAREVAEGLAPWKEG